jgi:hypothetical protein
MIVLMSENDAYGRWRNEPFPEGSTTDEVDEAHADLAYWDIMVADRVIPVVENGAAYNAGVLDIEFGLSQLHARTLALRERSSPSDAETLAAFQRYIELLIAANAQAAAKG